MPRTAAPSGRLLPREGRDRGDEDDGTGTGDHATPQQRIDLALPGRAPVAELLPALLRHAGEPAADDGARNGGWVLRRADGTGVEAGRTLGAQQIRDGEVLHLVPHAVDWPELEYDDLVDAVAAGAGRGGRLWAPGHSRLAGLGVAVVSVLLALVAVLRGGPPWQLPAATARAVAAVALVAGTLIARTAGDAGTGALLAVLALPAALLGGALVVAGSRPLSGLGAAHLLAGCSVLVVTAVLGRLGAVDLRSRIDNRSGTGGSDPAAGGRDRAHARPDR